MPEVLLRMALRAEHDIFVIRQRGREVAAALGMERQDQVRVATALSEVGRQLLDLDSVPTVTFDVAWEPRPVLVIVLTAPPDFASSEGVTAAARLLDGVEVLEDRIVLTRRLPASMTGDRIAQARAELAGSRPTSALDELSVQNEQLVTTLEEVQAQRDELLQLNA